MARSEERHSRDMLNQLVRVIETYENSHDMDALYQAAVLLLNAFADTKDERHKSKWMVQLRQDMFDQVGDLMVYDIIVMIGLLQQQSTAVTMLRFVVEGRFDTFRMIARSRTLGWGWERRCYFHPVHRRWAVTFLTLAKVAEQEGNPLGKLPLEILYRIINWVVQRDDMVTFYALCRR
jgi:hypothetical protein